MLLTRGTIRTFEYDKLGRQVHDRVTDATGVDGTVLRISSTYEVRGMIQTVTSASSPTAGTVVNEVRFAYNNFGQLAAEYQSHSGAVNTGTTPKVEYAYENGGADNTIRLKTLTYPSGRALNYLYESSTADQQCDRASGIWENEVPLVAYTRRGINSTVRIRYPEPDLEMSYIDQPGAVGGVLSGMDQYTGLDRFGRIVDIPWRNSSSLQELERYQYAFDRASNRLWRKNLKAAGLGEQYAYDGLYQLGVLKRGVLSSGEISSPMEEEDFTYDAMGNWTNYVNQWSGSPTLEQNRTHNEANEIAQIDGTASLVGYDAAGNMNKMPAVGNWLPAQTPVWDAWDRLVALKQGAATLATYCYDGLRRRVTQQTGEGTRHSYYSAAWQVLEERVDSETTPDRQYVWGLRYADDLVFRDRFGQEPGSSSSGASSPRLYALHDQWSVTAVASIHGTVQERFVYRAFGQPSFFSGTFQPRSGGSYYDWNILYKAFRYDGESKLYLARNRYLHYGLGRWLSRDPIGEFGGINLYQYVGNDPANAADPSGLFPPGSEVWHELSPGDTMPPLGDPLGALGNFLHGLGLLCELSEDLEKDLQTLQEENPWPETTEPLNMTIRDYGSWKHPIATLNVGLTLGQFRYTNFGGVTTIYDTYAFPWTQSDHYGGTTIHNRLLSFIPGEKYDVRGSYPTP